MATIRLKTEIPGPRSRALGVGGKEMVRDHGCGDSLGLN